MPGESSSMGGIPVSEESEAVKIIAVFLLGLQALTSAPVVPKAQL